MYRFPTLLALATAPVFAQTPASFVPDNPPFSVRITVGVLADPTLEGQVANCLARGLRAIPGVVVTQRDPDIKVHVIAMDIRIYNQHYAFALSCLGRTRGTVEQGRRVIAGS